VKRAFVLLLCAGLCAAGGVWYGRASAPAKTETKVVEVERVVEKRVSVEVQGPVRERIVTRDVPGPRGPERVVVHEIERGPVTKVEGSEKEAERVVEKVKVVTLQPRFMAGVKAGANLALEPRYGVEGKYRIAGPVWAGVEVGTYGGFVTLAFTF
jgi:hypothetical protein